MIQEWYLCVNNSWTTYEDRFVQVDLLNELETKGHFSTHVYPVGPSISDSLHESQCVVVVHSEYSDSTGREKRRDNT